jgi:hypothetical protein
MPFVECFTPDGIGQPMVYMSQEFNVERDRNFASFEWRSGPPPMRAGAKRDVAGHERKRNAPNGW